MPWTKEEKIFCVKQNFTRSFTEQLSPEKTNLSLGTQVSSHRVNK